MKNLSKLLAVSIFLVFGLFTAVTSFPQQLGATPPGDPPDANVSPTFTGLTVTGASSLNSATVTNNLSVGGALGVTGATTLNDATVTGALDLKGAGEIKNTRSCPLWQPGCVTHIFLNDVVEIAKELTLGASSGWNLQFEGVKFGVDTSENLIINGNVEIRGNLKANQIGRMYINSKIISVPHDSYNNESVTCNSGDWFLSCYGGFDPDDVGNDAGVTGFKPYSIETYQGCKAAGWNKTGSDKNMTVYASCIKPNANWGS